MVNDESKRMMSREKEILNASADTFISYGDEFTRAIKMLWVTAFIAGAAWADKHPANVWHQADEVPENGAHILMECKLLDSKEFKSYNIDYKGVVNWEVLKRYFGISRWAYISDLLPKGGEK